MKKKTSVFLALTFVILSCGKECEISDPICMETPPTDELCEAYFTRWFYNAETNTCSEIGFSGCNQKGFATKAACEACDCE